MWSMIPLMSRIPGSHSIPWSSVADLEKNERQSIMTESGRITWGGLSTLIRQRALQT